MAAALMPQAYGANADAIDCSMVFNEETAVTVQDPGSRLVMERCNMARNVIAAYTTVRLHTVTKTELSS